MEMLAKSELVGFIRERYLGANKKEKTQILDELVAVTGHHRKHAVRLLLEPILVTTSKTIFVGRKIYNDAVKDVLVTLWESSDRLCGKRLKVVLPDLLKSLEGHGHLKVSVQSHRSRFSPGGDRATAVRAKPTGPLVRTFAKVD